MSVEYDIYLAQHVRNVAKGLEWLRTNLPDLLMKSEGLEVNFDLQFSEHDKSKYDREEYFAYDEYFYGYNKSAKVVQNFNKAWLRHIHYNPHHWQHWVLINDEEAEGVICIEMPRRYVIEMICDWWSFSWSKGDLTEIFSWWDKHSNYIKLHPKTRRLVIGILNEIRKKLEQLDDDSLAHHGIKGQKWGVRRTPEELAAARGLASDEKSDTIVKDAIASGQVSTEINQAKQSRHLENGHEPGRSYIYGDMSTAQQLVNELSGTGTPLVSEDGTWLHKEKASSNKPIGIHVDANGNKTESSNAMIVYAKTGTHIYPRKEDEK